MQFGHYYSKILLYNLTRRGIIVKKIIKKILTTLCALTLCVFCLTGCSWLKIDKERYYNQVVVTVGDKEFTKKDLVEAFSNYGYQYYQSYGLSLEESINRTITSMIDRALLMDVVKEEIDANSKYAFTETEKKEIKKQAFDYMQDSINTYETKVRKEWKMEIEFDTESEKESLRTKKTEYTPKIKYDYDSTLNKFVVSRVEDKADTVYVPEDLPGHFSKNYRIVTNQKVADEAWTRYIKSLQDLAKSEGRSTVESDVLLYEENRLVELMTNNKYLEKFEKAFFDRTPVNTSAVLNYYREQYKSAYSTYSMNESLYHTAMQDASKNYIYYHVNSGNEYVNVKHILINFTQEQKDKINSLNTAYKITSDNTEANEKLKQNPAYQQQLAEIIGNTKSTFELSKDLYKQYGARYNFTKVADKEDTYEANASDIYKFVQDYTNVETFRAKSAKFDDLVYIFNDDSGFMNSEFDYVVNLDTSIEDKMVKPFANGVRALDTSNGGEGAGSMDMIVSNYGYHIIFHDGVAENLVDSNNIDTISDENLLYILCTNYTTPNSNKTIFNYIYDKLSLDDKLYDNMTQEIVKNERTKLKHNKIVIVYYEKRYEDLWK